MKHFDIFQQCHHIGLINFELSITFVGWNSNANYSTDSEPSWPIEENQFSLRAENEFSPFLIDLLGS